LQQYLPPMDIKQIMQSYKSDSQFTPVPSARATGQAPVPSSGDTPVEHPEGSDSTRPR
jgi:hypothetical protein